MNERLEQLIEKYLADFEQGRLNCAEVVLMAMGDYYGIDKGFRPMLATPFGGGMCATQRVCGALSGGLMVIGLRYGREPGGNRMPSYALGKQLFQWFEQSRGSADCRELTGTDFSDPDQMAGFRDPGGLHERVCAPLVGETCRWLAEHL